jgi:hypothetical protein
MLLLFSRARLRAPFVAITVAALCCVIGPGDALAAKGGKPSGGTGSTGGSGLSLYMDYWWTNPNPSAPSWCINEDDIHQRTWTGSLNGTATTTEVLCDASVDFSGGQSWSAGGEGLAAELWVTGTPTDLAITSPQGDSHHAVLMDSSTTKGVTTDHYSACYVPFYEATHDTGGMPLPGGTWTITLSGSITKVNYKVTANMTDVYFQQAHCPVSQQNITY